MSFIVKGIDLPKDDIVIHYANRYGEMETVYVDESNIIQIPKGHGDIKDINTVEDELDERCGQLSAEIVRNAPTILEAEE